jgi:hypothetical protein
MTYLITLLTLSKYARNEINKLELEQLERSPDAGKAEIENQTTRTTPHPPQKLHQPEQQQGITAMLPWIFQQSKEGKLHQRKDSVKGKEGYACTEKTQGISLQAAQRS